LTITFIASSYDNGDTYQEDIINDFNNYAKENNLDIYIDRTSLTKLNSSIHVDDFAAFIEAGLQKKATTYDIILIDNIYANRFADYASDLNKYLSKDIIDKYSTGVAPKIGLVGDKLVTMVSIFILLIKKK